MARQSLVSQGLILAEASPSHSVRLLWTSDQLVAETSYNTQPSQETNIHTPVGFEPAIAASERPQTHAIDRAANKKNPIGLHSLGWEEHRRGKTYRSCQKHYSLSVRRSFLVIYKYNKPAVNFMHSTNLIEHCKKITTLCHTQKTRLHLSLMYF